MDFISVEGKN